MNMLKVILKLKIQTNCLSNDSISLDEYYLNKTNNIYYHCFQNCKGCNDSFYIITKEMYCFNCIDNYYFIFDEYNCYNHSILEDNKYYFDSNDSKYHKCYCSCSKCLNYVPNETNHYCIECAENYYKLDDLLPNNCYERIINNESTILSENNVLTIF